MKNKTISVFLIVVIVFLLSSCITMNMDSLPVGELIDTIYSPDGTHKINSFLVSGNATVDFCIRCEVVNIASGEKRNIYWEYRCESAKVEWIDNTTVVINEKHLNIYTDSYDWRN